MLKRYRSSTRGTNRGTNRIASFEELALCHIDELYATALRYTKDDGHAQDLVQETFLKAFSNFDKFQEGTNCRAWLFTILTNTFINHYRRKKRERELLGSEDVRVIRENFHDTENSAYYQSVEDSAVRRQLSREVTETLEALPDDFRMAVVLADLNGFSYREIADILDCPVGTVMSRLYRGRKSMRKQLVDYAFERGIIADRGPFLEESTNRTRRSMRDGARVA